jgi:hypothetical protein
MRRPIVRLMQEPRIRLRVLSLLRIRPESGFITLSRGLSAIDMAMQRVKETGLRGDYYEFGLYRGYTFWYAQKAADRVQLEGMRFFGFDSFQGLPEVEGGDQKQGIFFSGDYLCTRTEVERQITAHGFDWARAALIEGFFDQSLRPGLRQEHEMGSAALVLIDCDLYQSTVPALRFLADLLQDGTVLLFDDWYCFGDSSDNGEPRAFREFLADHPEWAADDLMDFPNYGKAFVFGVGSF